MGTTLPDDAAVARAALVSSAYGMSRMITSWTPTQLAQITDGAWNHMPQESAQKTIEIDHRLLGDKGLFIALPGERHDGHDFIKELHMGNVRLSALLMSRAPPSIMRI